MVQGIAYSDRTDSKLWFRVLHIATGQTVSWKEGIDFRSHTNTHTHTHTHTHIIYIYIYMDAV